MQRYVIFPYKMGSRSGNTLKDSLRSILGQQRVIKVYADRNYRPRHDDIIINWGNSEYPTWWDLTNTGYDSPLILNDPQNVGIASNKLTCLQRLAERGVPTPDFTTNMDVAFQWDVIIVRTLLRGSEGRGIIVIDNLYHEVPIAPLYTKYIKPDGEYRVHIFNGRVIDYTKKVKRNENGETVQAGNEYVRNHGAGWTFMRGVEGDLNRIPEVEATAIQAVEALGLNFGSVDIIRRNRLNYVLEVNTASGLSDIGIDAYVNAFLQCGT